jgi:hypothetical protein
MSNVDVRPSSSSQLQRIVPTCTFVVLEPPNPLTTRLLGLSSPTKSSFTWEMQPEQRLSIPMGAESVSKCTDRSVAMAVRACIAKTDIAVMVPRSRCFFIVALSRRCGARLVFGLRLDSIQSPRRPNANSVLRHR